MCVTELLFLSSAINSNFQVQICNSKFLERLGKVGRFTQETNMKNADNANIVEDLTMSEAMITWKLKLILRKHKNIADFDI